jgi:hypothetical protein
VGSGSVSLSLPGPTLVGGIDVVVGDVTSAFEVVPPVSSPAGAPSSPQPDNQTTQPNTTLGRGTIGEMHTRFGLMMLGALLAGCPGDDGSSGETTSDDGTTSTTMMPSTSASTTTPPPGTSSSGSTTGETTTGNGTTGSDTDTDTTGGTSSGSSGDSTGGSTDTGASSTTEGQSACQAGCQVEVDCGFCSTEWEDVDECIEWCEANLVKAGEFADFCQAAWENVHACVGTLDCDEFADWCDREPPFDYPCITEDQTLEFECEGQ